MFHIFQKNYDHYSVSNPIRETRSLAGFSHPCRRVLAIQGLERVCSGAFHSNNNLTLLGRKMNFTKTPPTTPGFYAWKEEHSSFIQLWVVIESDILYQDGFRNKEWCRLVPAEEVRRAWESGRASVLSTKGWTVDWNESRAKKVAEGTI